MKRCLYKRLVAGVAAVLLAPLGSSAQTDPVNVHYNTGSLSFDAYTKEGGQLNVSGPGVSTTHVFNSGGMMTFNAEDDQGNPLPDGIYNYHLELTPSGFQADLDAMQQAQAAGDENTYTQLANRLQANDYDWQTHSGQFRVVNGFVEEYVADSGSRDPESNNNPAQKP